MPASLFEAFDSPYNAVKEKDNEEVATEKKPDLDLDYNSVLSPFFPKSTVTNAPYSTPSTDLNQSTTLSHPPRQIEVRDPPQLSGRDLLPLYTGPSAHPMRSGQHDCHDQIASILSCRVCREKLKLLLNDDYFRTQSGGGGPNMVSSLVSSVSSLTQNTDLVNLFLIIGMVLIIHKLFRK